MYERFTDRARKVMQLANQEAQRFKHEYIGTEHILLGLVQEGSGVAANVLKNLDIDLLKVRLEVEKILQTGPDMLTMGKMPQTPRAKKVIEYAIDEARSLNFAYFGTEHVLLGLIREQEGVAAQVLTNLGLRLDDVREEILNLLGLDKNGVIRDSTVSYELLQDLPEQVVQTLKELDAQIAMFDHAKEEAITDQDFERAARALHESETLKKQRQGIIREAR